MKLAIVNYGMGNLGSVIRTLESLGADTFIIDSPKELQKADRIILPGVGGFSEGMSRLRENGWVDCIRDAVLINKKPLLGICLGLQLLANKGEEGGDVNGLSLISGKVIKLDRLGCGERIPHIGWNDIQNKKKCPLFVGIKDGTDFYFVHSYAFQAAKSDIVSATVNYGVEIPAAISSNHVFGVQFHPEKSSHAGRQLLKNFLEYESC